MSAPPARHDDVLLPPRSAGLAAAWALLAAAPLLLIALNDAAPLERAFGWTLLLAATALPALWIASGPAQGARAAFAEALLLAAATLPALALAWPLARAQPLAAARACGFLAALLGVIAAARAWGPSGDRAARVALALAWSPGLALALLIGADLDLRQGPLLDGARALSPLAAMHDLLDGRTSLGAPLLALGAALGVALGASRLVVAVVGGASGGVARALRARAQTASGAPASGARGPGPPPSSPLLVLVAAPLLALGVGALAAAPSRAQERSPSALEARPLLGPYVRPGEPYPLTLVGDPGAPERLVGARSFGHRFLAPLRGGRARVYAAPLEGSYALELIAAVAEGWGALRSQLPAPQVVGTQDLLIGALGPAGGRARALFGARAAGVVPLDPGELELLARAGEALDVVVVAAGAAREPTRARALLRWAAAGGAVVTEDRGDLDAVLEAAGSGGTGRPMAGAGPMLLVPVGAGWLAGPRRAHGAGDPGGERSGDAPSDAEPPGQDPRGAGASGDGRALDGGLEDALVAELTGRTRRRAARAAVEEQLAATLQPAPGAALRVRLALAALSGGVALALLALLSARVPRASFLAGAVVASLALTVALRQLAAPGSPALARSSQVLEAPAGARIARRLSVTCVRAARPASVTLDLRGDALAWPLFAGKRQAVSSEGALLAGARQEVTLPLAATPRAFARRDAVDLGGAVHLERHADARAGGLTIRNGTTLPLEDVLLLSERGVLALGDLAPGAATEVGPDARAVRFARWRALGLGADDDPRARQRIAAAVGGRDLRGRWLLVAEVPGTPQVASGVADEHAEPALLLVTAPGA